MKYIFLQNIIAPYRVSLFNYLKKCGFDFEVLYMSLSESDRNWKINLDTLKYDYILDKGLYYQFKGFHLHFNWKLIKYIYSNPSTIILGSSWNDLNVMTLCLMKRIGLLKHHNLIFWTEANYMTIGARKSNYLRDCLRNYIFNSNIFGFVVPGQMALLTLQRWNVKIRNYCFLPNVIEEDRLKEFVGQRSYASVPNFIMPVRIEEKIKGIINFFEAIGIENIKRCKFHILGDGSDRKLVEDYVNKNNLKDSIILYGFCETPSIVKHYIMADAFLLPSFSDQSPLAIVEACYYKLPLLISERCGNHYETLVEGKNGYKFDPDNHIEVRNKFEQFLNCRSEWPIMGEVSRKMYEDNFAQRKVIEKFINSVQAFK